MVHISRAYSMEKQMPSTFWYFAIKHSARMMNMIPGKYRGKLASPFMLVHGVHPDPRTWLPLFSLCYFHHDKDNKAPHSKNQAHTLGGIVIGPLSTSNALPSTTNKISNIMSQTAIGSTHTIFLPWFILQLFMTAACLYLSIVTARSLQASPILRELGL